MKKPKLKPRNPLVAAALFKKAGEHGRAAKAQRRQDKMTLRRELAVSKHPAGRAASAGSSLPNGGFATRMPRLH